MANFWQRVKEKAREEGRPLFVLAPMADVTDCVFRILIAEHSRAGEPGGGPDVFWTEFVSAEGLMTAGRDVLKRDLFLSERERPIVAQLFGNSPDKMRAAAKRCREIGFDGIDINMGCPDRSIEKHGSGACMIKNPEKAREIIRASIEGADPLPVSVKTRIGYNKIEYKPWLAEILKENIAALTLHLRTRKELSLVPAHWELGREINDFVRSVRPDVVLLGNGDVKSLEEGVARTNESGFDGVMVGRGIFGTPWFFDRNLSSTVPPRPVLRERFEILIRHTKMFEQYLGDIKSFAIMKKHYKAYLNNFDGAKELRDELMTAHNSIEVEAIVRAFMAANPDILE